MKLKNYQAAYQYISRLTNYEKKVHYTRRVFKLSRMRWLMNQLENPDTNLRFIHIAGTKGKSSTAIFINSLLQSSGYKVGLYTSPHLVDLRERIQINSQPISKKAFTRLMNILVPYLRKKKLTFFETMTALAILYFAKEKVDYAVMEVGIGGRLDATNIIQPVISIITRIDFDHMDKLGWTLSSIAREKAGIIKPFIPVITISQQPEAMRVIQKTAQKRKAPLQIVSALRNQFRINGQHQLENLALALAAYKYLCPEQKLKIHRLQSIVSNTHLPARIEVVNRQPLVIIDTAHNVVSMKALVDTIREKFKYRRLILIIGISRDKEVDKILRIILPLAQIIIFTRADNPRLLEPIEFINYIKDYDLSVPIFLEPNCRKALHTAQQIAASNDLILITGSFYLAGALYPCFKK